MRRGKLQTYGDDVLRTPIIYYNLHKNHLHIQIKINDQTAVIYFVMQDLFCGSAQLFDASEINSKRFVGQKRFFIAN